MHTKPTSVIHVSDGLSQHSRVLAPLKENYFNVDELTFEQLLALGRDYARVVTYYKLDNRAEGVWDTIFSANEMVVMATILAIQLRKLEAGFEKRLLACHDDFSFLFRDYRNNPAKVGLPETASPLTLAHILDNCLLLLSGAQSDAGEELRSLIVSVVIGLRNELQTLEQIAAHQSEPINLKQLFSASFSVIAFRDADAGGVLSESEAADPLVQRAAMSSVFSSLIQALDIVQAGARRLLPDSMHSKSHDPAAAMLITFIKLYQKLQLKINGFTQNHLDFYYQQVLQAKPKLLVADSVHLLAQVTTPGGEVRIEQGTPFSAGLDDDKQDIIYTADHTVILNDAAVTRLVTLFFPRDIASGSQTTLASLTTACWQNEIPAKPDMEEKERDALIPHPLMGAARDGKCPSTVTQARIGFALADSVLLMSEGRRKLMVSLQYDQLRSIGEETLEGIVRKLTPVASDADDQARIAAEKNTFFKLFSDMFSISLTGTQGWLDIEAYLPSCSLIDEDIKPNCLQISFSLPSDSTAVTGYLAAKHGEQFDTALPVVRFTLNHNEYQYPYDILRNLALKEARIDVRVQGCRELLLHNNVGQLSPLAPFTPFGPLPTVGSYFIVGHAETRTKQLSYCDIEVEWGDLPPSGTDFPTHYKAYSNPPATQDFVANVSVLSNGKWQSGNPRSTAPIKLFNISQDLGRVGVALHKRLSCAQVVPLFKPLDNYHADNEFVYTPSSKNGLFKFTLAGPVDAFGHQEYPHLLSSTLTYNAKVKSPSLLKPIPTAPYTPQITAISMNYSAFSIISTEKNADKGPEIFKNKLFHLHPLGWESLSNPNGSCTYQLPQYDAPGMLFIGLSSPKMSDSLTLYFHLHRDSLPMPEGESSELQWAYLSNNQWRMLEPRQIVSDSTQGFMTSGIVTLHLPADISCGNTIMPGDQYWLRVSAQRNLKNFCNLYSVYAQAIQASWRGGKDDARHEVSLRAGSISRAQISIPGLGKVTQLNRSFNGKPAETTAHLRTRLSERLRHKNRALNASDYEALILDQFPDIYKVKCFANLRTQYPGKVCPGHVLIVPVPYLSLDGHQHQRPRLSGHMIREVQQFVQKLAPPFAQISVENPEYEEIQVRCRVTFKPGLRGGQYANQLNTALCEYLTPWKQTGYTTHFGWCVRQYDLESYIQSLDYIDQVSDFSMLRVAQRGEQLFRLDDSARPLADGSRKTDFTPLLPWNIAVPISRHFIQIADDYTMVEPCITGIEELEVGSTFIISGKE